jgi:hypothetical protein
MKQPREVTMPRKGRDHVSPNEEKSSGLLRVIVSAIVQGAIRGALDLIFKGRSGLP